MVSNPAGLVIVYDFGAPRIVSGYARAAMSGGDFVYVSGAAAAVSSGAATFNPKTDLLFNTGASGTLFNGVAMFTAASGAPVSVLLDGIIIATCDGTVTAGQTVICGGASAVANGTAAGTVVGRALTGDASGGYALIHIGGR